MILYFELFFINLLLCVSSISSGILQANDEPIVTIPNEFPWVVRIENEGVGDYIAACHGAILNDRWIITNHICGWEPLASQIVIAGDFDIYVSEETEQIRNVTRIIQTPEYTLPGGIVLAAEVALFELSSPLIFNQYVQSIPMARSLDILRPEVTKVSWKLYRNGSGEDDWTAGNMTKTASVLINDEECQTRAELIEGIIDIEFRPEEVICAGSWDFLSCSRVEGEPMLCETSLGVSVLCGIGNFAMQCTKQDEKALPMVYSEIGFLYDWIAENINT